MGFVRQSFAALRKQVCEVRAGKYRDHQDIRAFGVFLVTLAGALLGKDRSKHFNGRLTPMLLPGLPLQKPTSVDSATLSRSNIENGKLPEVNRSSFRENLDRQIDNQRRSDRQDDDRLAKQLSLRQQQMDHHNDAQAEHHPLEHKLDERTVIESRVSKEKQGQEDEEGNSVATNADVVLDKPAPESKQAESALTFVEGEPAKDDAVSALIVNTEALPPDEAIDALMNVLDGRGLNDNMALLWKRGDQFMSAPMINHKNMNGDSKRQDVSALTGLDKPLFDTNFVGDPEKGTIAAKDGVNITSLMMSTNKGELPRDGKIRAVDPALFPGELNLAMGAGDVLSKTLRSVRMGTSALLTDATLTAQNLSSQQREQTGKIAMAANALPSALMTGSSLSPDFVNRLSEQVMWLRHQNINVAELRLHPRDLGSVLVRIDSSGDNTSVNFVAAHHTVRDVLDQNMTKLRELFSDAGLNLVNVNVSSESPSQQEQRDRLGSGSTSGFPSSLFNQEQDAGLDEMDTDQRGPQSIHLVDFFA